MVEKILFYFDDELGKQFNVYKEDVFSFLFSIKGVYWIEISKDLKDFLMKNNLVVLNQDFCKI
jgi:hypothetical protein